MEKENIQKNCKLQNLVQYATTKTNPIQTNCNCKPFNACIIYILLEIRNCLL